MTGSGARLTFLGTGTSQGVPIIGCKCDVCRSADPRDKRFRASVFVEYGGLNILVDAGPDFRMQMIGHEISHLDAILLTHNHKDHTGGLDDVRSLNYIDRRAAEIYCERNVLEDLIREYPYVFKFPKYPGAPEWMLHVIDEHPFILRKDSSDKELVWVHDVGYHYRMNDGTLVPTARSLDDMISTAEVASLSGETVDIIPIRGLHDKLPVLGFRFGDIAYLTDMSEIPESEFAKLQGLKHLTLNTVGYNKHHSHFSLQETLTLADRIRPTHTWLTHLSHSFPVHEQFCKELERMCQEQHIHSTVLPAYDGLVID
ncbi:MAG: MBL fold metallo-hydrolase [Bacteroidales bacterium]|nr:MBL fold metallo-hydrolase [Bacteroidales bacterium]